MKITKEEHESLIKKIYAYDYYTHILKRLQSEYSEKVLDQQTVEFWNDFWIYLPDNSDIRREPFFEICIIAERIYDVET